MAISYINTGIKWAYSTVSRCNRWAIETFVPSKINEVIVPIAFKYWSSDARVEYMANNHYISFFANYYNLSNSELEKYSKIYFNCNINGFIKNIEKFHLSQAKLNEYAQKLMHENSGLFIDNIEKFNLLENNLHEYFKVLIEKKSAKIDEKIADNIEKFFLDQTSIESFAKQLYISNPNAFCRNIEKFAFSNKQLENYAERLFQVRSQLVLYNIDKFRLPLEKRQYYVAEAFNNILTNEKITENMQKRMTDNFVYNIEKYELLDNDLHTYAFKILKLDPILLCYNIDKFKLPNDELHKYAQFFLQYDSFNFIKNIQKFKFSQQERLAYVQKLIFTNHQAVFKYIDELSLNKENWEYLINKLLKENIFYFVNYIDKFKLPRVKVLEIAEKVVSVNPEVFASNVQKFNFDNEQYEYYATLLLESNSLLLVKNIHLFVLNKQFLKHILKQLILKEPYEVFLLDVFNCLSKKELEECAEKLFSENPYKLLQNIEIFQLSTEKMHEYRKEYGSRLFLEDPYKLLQNIEIFQMSTKKMHEYAKVFKKLYPKEFLQKIRAFKYFNEIAVIKDLLISSPDAINGLDINYASWWFSCQSCLIDETLPQSFYNTLDFVVNKCGLYLQRHKIIAFLNKLHEEFSENSKLLFPRVIQALLINKNSFSNIEAMYEKYIKHKNHPRLKFLIFCIYFLNIEEGVKTKLFEFVSINAKTFKDDKNSKILLQLFIKLSFIEASSKQENILNQLIERDESKNLMDRIRFIQAMIDLKQDDLIQKEYLSHDDLLKIFTRIFLKAIDVEVSAANIELFQTNILKKFKDPYSLLVYLGKINTADNEKSKKELKPFFKEWFLAILENRYKQWQKERSPHIQKLLELQVSPQIIDKWMKDFQSSGTYTLENQTDFELQNVRFKKYIKEKLIPRHSSLLQTRFPLFYTYLTTHEKVEINLNKESYNEDKLQQQLIMACSKKDYSNWQHLKIFLKDPSENRKGKKRDNAIYEYVPEYAQILKYIEEFKQTPISVSSTSKQYYFSITSSAEDLMYLGRETGGCQNIDHPLGANKNLLGYADGKNKVWAIRSEDGKFVARAIARLLWSETKKKPVIYLEPFYMLNEKPEIYKNFVEKAKHFAKFLKLELVFAHNYRITNKTQILKVFGSIAPYEYYDAFPGEGIDQALNNNFHIKIN